MLKRRQIIGYLFLLPFVVHFATFVLYPFAMSIYYSLTDYNMLYMTSNYIGLDNYSKLIGNQLFLNSIKNTAIYVLIDGTGVVVFGLVLALLLNIKLKGIGIFRTIFYLPVVV